jgi:hypothetical protein
VIANPSNLGNFMIADSRRGRQVSFPEDLRGYDITGREMLGDAAAAL